ncbi:type II secretion system protein GspD [Undibacterium squillarum]|uniref:Type IV pilus biogenesis and competence protein PilQ n=2 Tax=Undibacterium squillarum TaxID=1131567 RepID=A0ABQ2Y1R9_9BURK|nr:type II secretion system protein GspD [Undibacterium squillarum]
MKIMKSTSKATMKSQQARSNQLKLSAIAAAVALAAGCMTAATSFAQTQSPAQAAPNTVDLNFVNADIESVIKAVGHFTGMTFIIDPRVKGQITLQSEKPLTRDQAFKLLTSTLRLQTYSVVYSDGYYKVVPETDAKLQSGPANTTEKSEGNKGDQVVTQVFRMNYEAANNIVTVIRPLISPNNSVAANPGNNTLVITDYADNLKRIAKIIAALDVPPSSDLEILPLRHAIASDMAAMVAKLIENNGSAEAGRTVVMADPRTNAVLVRAPSAARANLVKSLVEKLDQPTKMPGNVHVVYLKNAEAVKLAATLRSIVTGDTSAQPNLSSGLQNLGSSLGGGNTQSGTGAAQTGSGLANANTGVTGGGLPQSSTSSQQSSSGGSGAGFIQADAATNTLIITASEPVYRNLRAVIDQLDARRAQVYVEALIVEISADKVDELGVQWAALTGDDSSNIRVGGVTSFTDSGNNLLSLATSKSPTPTSGLTLGIFKNINGKLGLGAVAHALQSKGNANILSMPNLLTLDNEEARITVGQNVPFVTGQFTTSASTGSAGVNPFQTIERKEIGLKLTVKPQISEGGTVKLAIYQENSSIDTSVSTGTTGLITKLRTIATNVLIEDGEVLALGGLIEDSASEAAEKVPLLGDLPVVGNLFRYQTNKRGKTNLMVFLRPVVIRSAEQGAALSLDRYDYMRTQISPALSPEFVNQGLRMDKGKLVIPSAAKPASNSAKEKQ